MSKPWEQSWNDVATGGRPDERPQETGIVPWLKSWVNPEPTKSTVSQRDTGSKKISNRFDDVFQKLIMAESGGKHTDERGKLTTSPVGAQGITQLMPATAKKPGFGIEPVKDTSESEYKRVGRAYLEKLVERYEGDFRKALAAYNAGMGNVDKAIAKGGEKWMEFLPKKEETIPYVKKILGDSAQFEGENTKPLNQQEDEKAYKFTLADAAKKGLLSEEGRKAFRRKVFDEHQKAYNALSKKEKDKFYSHSGFYMKDKYPEEYEMLQLLDGPLEGLTDRQLSAIGLEVPFSKGKTRGEGVGGYVFTDNPDRAFITHLGDTSTAVHEKEHLTTQDQLEPVKTLGQIGRLGEPVPQFRRLATVGESEWFKKNKVMQKVFKSLNALDTNNEFLANIAAYEAALPEGQSIYESEFASELKKKFGEEGTKAILDQAVAYTLTNKGRIAETDFEFDKKRIDSNDSYAKQLYTYLKNKFGD